MQVLLKNKTLKQHLNLLEFQEIFNFLHKQITCDVNSTDYVLRTGTVLTLYLNKSQNESIARKKQNSKALPNNYV